MGVDQPLPGAYDALAKSYTHRGLFAMQAVLDDFLAGPAGDETPESPR